MNRSRTMNTLGWLSLALVTLIAACNDRTATPTVTTVSPTPMMSPATTGQQVRVADITGNPDNYVGRTVTVVADVDEVRGPRAFKLDEDAPLAGGIDNDLWVLSPQAGSLANIDDQWLNNKVRVTGTVRRYVTADIEREIGWDLDAQLEAGIERMKVVLVASAVERVQ